MTTVNYARQTLSAEDASALYTQYLAGDLAGQEATITPGWDATCEDPHHTQNMDPTLVHWPENLTIHMACPFLGDSAAVHANTTGATLVIDIPSDYSAYKFLHGEEGEVVVAIANDVNGDGHTDYAILRLNGMGEGASVLGAAQFVSQEISEERLAAQRADEACDPCREDCSEASVDGYHLGYPSVRSYGTGHDVEDESDDGYHIR